MNLYRMVFAEHGSSLQAPGVAGRWNSFGKLVLYSSEFRSLSCLENIVHRSTEGLLKNFFILVIEVPDPVEMETLSMERLPVNWHLPFNYKPCQIIGDEWIARQETCLLKVPSAIIQEEFNFIINVKHQDFQQIRIIKKEKFLFDPSIYY